MPRVFELNEYCNDYSIPIDFFDTKDDRVYGDDDEDFNSYESNSLISPRDSFLRQHGLNSNSKDDSTIHRRAPYNNNYTKKFQQHHINNSNGSNNPAEFYKRNNFKTRGKPDRRVVIKDSTYISRFNSNKEDDNNVDDNEDREKSTRGGYINSYYHHKPSGYKGRNFIPNFHLRFKRGGFNGQNNNFNNYKRPRFDNYGDKFHWNKNEADNNGTQPPYQKKFDGNDSAGDGDDDDDNGSRTSSHHADERRNLSSVVYTNGSRYHPTKYENGEINIVDNTGKKIIIERKYLSKHDRKHHRSFSTGCHRDDHYRKHSSSSSKHDKSYSSSRHRHHSDRHRSSRHHDRDHKSRSRSDSHRRKHSKRSRRSRSKERSRKDHGVKSKDFSMDLEDAEDIDYAEAWESEDDDSVEHTECVLATEEDLKIGSNAKVELDDIAQLCIDASVDFEDDSTWLIRLEQHPEILKLCKSGLIKKRRISVGCGIKRRRNLSMCSTYSVISSEEDNNSIGSVERQARRLHELKVKSLEKQLTKENSVDSVKEDVVGESRNVSENGRKSPTPESFLSPTHFDYDTVSLTRSNSTVSSMSPRKQQQAILSPTYYRYDNISSENLNSIISPTYNNYDDEGSLTDESEIFPPPESTLQRNQHANYEQISNEDPLGADVESRQCFTFNHEGPISISSPTPSQSLVNTPPNAQNQILTYNNQLMAYNGSNNTSISHGTVLNSQNQISSIPYGSSLDVQRQSEVQPDRLTPEEKQFMLKEFKDDAQHVSTVTKMFIRLRPDLENDLVALCKGVLGELSGPIKSMCSK